MTILDISPTLGEEIIFELVVLFISFAIILHLIIRGIPRKIGFGESFAGMSISGLLGGYQLINNWYHLIHFPSGLGALEIALFSIAFVIYTIFFFKSPEFR